MKGVKNRLLLAGSLAASHPRPVNHATSVREEECSLAGMLVVACLSGASGHAHDASTPPSALQDAVSLFCILDSNENLSLSSLLQNALCQSTQLLTCICDALGSMPVNVKQAVAGHVLTSGHGTATSTPAHNLI
jgi:hypothetical protein